MYFLLFTNQDLADKVHRYEQEEMRDMFTNEELTVLSNGLPVVRDKFIVRDVLVCTKMWGSRAKYL